MNNSLTKPKALITSISKNNLNNAPENKRMIYVDKRNIKQSIEQTLNVNSNLKTAQHDSINNKVLNQPDIDTLTYVNKKPTYKQTVKNAGNDEDSIKKNEDYDKISVQLFASPDLPFSSIHSTDHNYQQLLQNAISMRLSYTLGAGVSVAVTKKISLSTGMQYSRVNERISQNDSLASKYSTHNHFTFINIPFSVKYKTSWTNQFQTFIHAGILLNISSKYKGRIPNNFGGLTDINHSVYKSNTGLSIYTGINFSKKITNKADVFAEPYFRYQPKNVTDNIQPFSRKISTVGIAFGIQYSLFKKEE